MTSVDNPSAFQIANCAIHPPWFPTQKFGELRGLGVVYILLFETLFAALRDTLVERRPAPPRDDEANTTLAFFEAYFSNFIEGTEFTVEEAAEIVFEGIIPQERPADAHDDRASL